MARCGNQRRNVGADQENFAALKDDISLANLCAPGSDRLDFPAFEHHASFVSILDEVVVMGFSIFSNAHGVVAVQAALIGPGDRIGAF